MRGTMKKIVNALVAMALLGLLSGCSVGMAMSGKETPKLGVVKQDASRGVVESQLGAPIKVTTRKNGHVVNVYEYEVGNDPSPGRALGHAAMDVLTLGTWEIIGTPVEVLQGEVHQIQIEYDANDRVVSVKGYNTTGK